jgi:hypothetical protein
MQIVPLAALQEPDERVRRFTPLGLSMGGILTAADAADYEQRAIASIELVEAVPEGTRSTFERLRTLHSYGILCYETFTAVADLAPLVVDLALRERFLAHCSNKVAALDKAGTEHLLEVRSVGELVEALKKAKLHLRDWPTNDRFAGGFGQLLRWARRHDLLSGQRARRAEEHLETWRNHLAHPDGYHLVMPVDSAKEISDVAEVINRLWGSRTPGGRLYPAPIPREVLSLAFGGGTGGSVGLAEVLPYHTSLHDATVLLVRGVREDEDLFEFDSGYEKTYFPTELLWGPGGYEDALRWLDETRPQPDTVDHLDRWFMMRTENNLLHLPRRPAVVAGLAKPEQGGCWYLVQADFPKDAFTHIRFRHQPFLGPCRECFAEGAASGSWEDVVAAARDFGIDMTPVSVPEARMPRQWEWPSSAATMAPPEVSL